MRGVLKGSPESLESSVVILLIVLLLCDLPGVSKVNPPSVVSILLIGLVLGDLSGVIKADPPSLVVSLLDLWNVIIPSLDLRLDIANALS